MLLFLNEKAWEDALNTNQVLLEEIKVKTAIIEADKYIAEQGEISNNVSEPVVTRVKCRICDWSSDNKTYLYIG